MSLYGICICFVYAFLISSIDTNLQITNVNCCFVKKLIDMQVACRLSVIALFLVVSVHWSVTESHVNSIVSVHMDSLELSVSYQFTF